MDYRDEEDLAKLEPFISRDSDERQVVHKRFSWIDIKLVLLVICGLLSAAIVALSIAYVNLSKSAVSPQSTGHDCGNSPTEALGKGCVFDLMNYAYTPPECYDQALVDVSLPSK